MSNSKQELNDRINSIIKKSNENNENNIITEIKQMTKESRRFRYKMMAITIVLFILAAVFYSKTIS